MLSVTNDLASLAQRSKREWLNWLLHGVTYGALLVPWLAVMKLVGSSFLGSKYILYYSVFFYLGWLWRKYGERVAEHLGQKGLDAIYAAAVVVWFAILTVFNVYTTSDSGLNIIIRAACSLLGCVVIIHFVLRQYKDGAVWNWLANIGVLSLEIYWVHMLFTDRMPLSGFEWLSLGGIITILLYTAVITAVSLVIIKLCKVSDTLNLVLFGIKPQKN